MIKRYSVKQNQISEQEYSGLTLAEVEKMLITEKPESLYEYISRVSKQWVRLLFALIAVTVLAYGAIYILGLQQEINELRGNLDYQSANPPQVENSVQNLPIEITPPVNSVETPQKEAAVISVKTDSQSGITPQAENTGQNQAAVVIPPSNPGQAPPSESIVHIVQKGDSLALISIIYYGKEDFAPDLAELNDVSGGWILFAGQEIKVPVKPYESWIK
jgi:LysM repeat protein